MFLFLNSMPPEKYHNGRAAEELKKLSPLAAQFLSEYGPGKKPDIDLLRSQAEYTGMPVQAENCLCEIAAMVASDSALTSLYTALLDLSVMEKYHEQAAGPMQALVLFGALPQARAKHAAMGIPAEITHNTFQCLAQALEEYAQLNDGALGIKFFTWLRNHLNARLFQIGRLQYMLTEYAGYARVFVDDITGEVVLTARGGEKFSGSGLVSDKGEGCWTSEYDEDADRVNANCLLVNGRAVRTKVSLDKKVWRPVLFDGAYRLEVHIPGGARLLRADCLESMQKAWQFFHQYFPDKHFEAFTCESWLMGTAMQNFLPPSSGIVRFQKLFSIYPVAGSGDSFIQRIFCVDPKTVNDVISFARTADRSTGLRRGAADYLLSGGRLCEAAGVIHQYDMQRFCYDKQ